MRRWVFWISAFAVALAVVPPLLIARARMVRSIHPRIHPIPDMDNQPKLKPQQASPLFEDHRAMRPPVANALARGELHSDTHKYQGKMDDQWATTFPIPVTPTLMRRGRARYNVFCVSCHGAMGYGDGPVSQRAEALQEGVWVLPPSFHQDQARQRPVGELFDFISRGVRTMPAYGPQIPVADRWAIVAYVRALQRSKNARLEDVPPEAREDLK
jgi:mono/diheme cytochrome c family protein